MQSTICTDLPRGKFDYRLPTGMVFMFAGAIGVGGAAPAPPRGWLLCDGSAVSRNVYSSLFAIIGTNFGVGDGSTTFNLPDLRGRSPLGTGQGPITNWSIGQKAGEETHPLITAELASHTHDLQNHTHTQGTHTHNIFVSANTGSGTAVFGLGSASPTFATAAGGGVTTNAPSPNSTGSQGSGTAHNTIHPIQTINFIIKT